MQGRVLGLGTALAVPLIAMLAPGARADAGDFSTSFEAGQPQPAWVSTPETDAHGTKLESGVIGSSVLPRSPSMPSGDDVLGHPTGELAWEGPFQNGVGSVPGTIAPQGSDAEHWTMQSHGETWIQVPMPQLARGTSYRAQVTLQGSGKLFLNAYSGSSDVGGDYVSLSGTPQTLTVDFTTPASGGGTPQLQIRTHDTEAIDAVVSGTSVRRLQPGSVDFPGNVTGEVTTVTASAENPPNEVASTLADGDVNTKWFAGATTATATYELSKPEAVVAYALASANDSPGRDPRDFKLEGSTDGSAWTTLDTRTNQGFADRFLTREYTVSNTTAYRFYRLDITANAGDPAVQLAEWMLSTQPIAPSDMTAAVGNGPSSGYNIRPNVGWTGTHALRYSGSQTATGRGYAYDKVLDVDVPVTATSELSYKLFPEPTGNDLRNPSTSAAIDLRFTDGTYLSRLGDVNPSAQGTSKRLYTNQWNSVKTRIGTLAAGKTIDRILIGYDNPDGPADFSGWVDDVAVVAHPATSPSSRPSDHVLTTRGTNSSGSFSRGNDFPATAVPHGFNFWTPVTDAGSDSWLYSYQSQNDAGNEPELQAFSLSHEPSPWMGDRQTFQVMPEQGAPTLDRSRRALAFKHENEIARAHYYGVTFDNGMKTEITPTDHAAMFRFSFTGSDSSLVFDDVNANAGLTLDPATRSLSGYTDVSSGSNSVGMTRMYIYATVDQPVVRSGPFYLSFDARVVNMRIATSLISLDQAKRNLALEIAPSDTFETVATRAQAAWDKALGVIEVQGASDDQLTTLYSNLYRLNLYPNSAFENTGTAAKPVYAHADQSSTDTDPARPVKVVPGKVYVNNGFWDTYRTTWPAYSLLYPQQAGEMVNGFVQQYLDGGWVSRWSSPGYANIMTGTSSDVAFADAYLKGVPGIDVKDMYDAAIKNATVAPPNDNVGRKGLTQGLFLGYTPTSTPESVSWSLEGDINDFGIANLSKALYDKTHDAKYLENYEYFSGRAQDYANLFNPQTGFFMGRTASGDWGQPASSFDPRVWGGDYTESDGWNFAFHAPQDGTGLASLYGGPAKLADKLDQFFSTPETAQFPGSYGGTIHEMLEARAVQLGQWGLSNQLSHHIPYMYDFTGEPSKGAAIIREALSRTFSGSDLGEGYPGDEDNGELSAWQLFSSLGFYPLQMGSPTYAIGSPLYTKATIHLAGGRDLVISAPRNSDTNVYVRGVTVNGKAQTKTYFTQDQLARGGTIVFDMGAAPSKWGTRAADAPPSLTAAGAKPDPLTDVTRPGDDRLFDDDSSTEGSGPATVKLAGATPRVTMYTLTSSSDASADPGSWQLLGSDDGTHWTPLDTRIGQSFTWRRQTRAFTIAHPGVYRSYRVSFTGRLAEVELLAHTPKLQELADAIDAARDISKAEKKTLAPLVTDSTLEHLRAALDTATAKEVGDASRANLRLLLSQWLEPATGLDEMRARIGDLTRSGDIRVDLQGIVADAEAAQAGSHAARLTALLGQLRDTVAGDKKVDSQARAVLLPLIDALLQTPPSVARAKTAAGVLMAAYDPVKAWWPSSWWNSAVALQTIEDYMLRTGDRAYVSQLDTTFEKDKGTFPGGVLSGDPLLGSFTSRAIDDSEWWGLTWVGAYDVTHEQKYLDMAVTIADYVQGYWDPSTCGGGVWWDAEKTYKNAITNGLYVRLTAELHNRLAGDTTWLARSKAGWSWLTGSGMINAQGLVNDGLGADCRNNGGTVWSYNQGVAIGAGAELYRATHDASVLATARRLADAATSPGSPLVSHGILTEKCDPDASCDDNAKQFKGVFMRYLSDLGGHQAFIDRQATSVWDDDRDAHDRLGVRYAGGTPNVFDWRTQASAMSALIEAIRAT